MPILKKARAAIAIGYLRNKKEATNKQGKKAAKDLEKFEKNKKDARTLLHIGNIFDVVGLRDAAAENYNKANEHFELAAFYRRKAFQNAAEAVELRNKARQTARAIAGKNGMVKKKGASK